MSPMSPWTLLATGLASLALAVLAGGGAVVPTDRAGVVAGGPITCCST